MRESSCFPSLCRVVRTYVMWCGVLWCGVGKGGERERERVGCVCICGGREVIAC